jgi:Tol biopolymer transport system component
VLTNAFNADLWVMNANGTGLRRLTKLVGTHDRNAEESNADWRPDGKAIILTGNHQQSVELYTMRPDGTGLRRLRANPARDDWRPRYSPDGKRIVWWSAWQDSPNQIWTANADGTGARYLTRGADADFRP